MKRSDWPPFVLCCFFACFALTLLILLPQFHHLDAQGCGSPPLLPNAQMSSWPQGSAVVVNISPSFSLAERNAIQAGFVNWQNANGPDGNSSGVTFSFTSNSTPASGTNTHQVNIPDTHAQEYIGLLLVLRNAIAHGNGRKDAVNPNYWKTITLWERRVIGVSTDYGYLMFSEAFVGEMLTIVGDSLLDLIERVRASKSTASST